MTTLGMLPRAGLLRSLDRMDLRLEAFENLGELFGGVFAECDVGVVRSSVQDRGFVRKKVPAPRFLFEEERSDWR